MPYRLLLAFVLAVTLATPAVAVNTTPLFTLYPVIGSVEDRFGNHLAVTDRHVLVGSYLEDQPGATALFALDTGAPVVTFKDPQPTESSDNDGFGFSVAASSRLLVIGRAVPPAVFVYDRRGNPLDRIDIPGYPTDPCASIGSVAIHARRIAVSTNCGVLVVDGPNRRRFIPRPSGDTGYGFGAAMVLTSRRLYVSSLRSTVAATEPGIVYAFDARTGDSLWEAVAPFSSALDGFGSSLDVVGSRLLVGAPGEDADGPDVGAVYALDAATGALRRRYANPSGNAGERFGNAVAGDGKIVVVGAPDAEVDESGAGVAYVLDARAGGLLDTLAPRPNESDAHAARAVAVTRTRILVGGSDWSGIGMVAVYRR